MKQTKRKRDVAKASALTSAPALSKVSVFAASELTSATSTNDGPESAMTNSANGNSTQLTEHASAQSPVYTLGANCTVRDSLAIKSALLDLVMDERLVTIDVRTVKRIDTAVLQVLCAFVGDRSAAGGHVQWLGGSESFSEAVRLLGLKDVLGISAEFLMDGAT